MTAEMTMSVSRTASAADSASRMPNCSPAALSLAPALSGKQNVPGGDALDAGLAQARGDRLSGFAEADEGNAGRVAAGHGGGPWVVYGLPPP